MTKSLFLLLSILFVSSSHAVDVSDCLTDAESFGNHTHSIIPHGSCLDLLKHEPERIEAQSTDSVWRAYAYKHMLYLEKYDGGTLLSRELLAGDQTLLRDIRSISIDLNHRKLLLLQEGLHGTEFLSFSLDFIGNVSPKSFLSSELAEGAQGVSLNTEGTELNLHFPSVRRIYSASADSRYADQALRFETKLLRTEAPSATP